jgi:hypothetical protein
VNSPSGSSSVLLRAYVPRWNSAIGVTLGALVTALCGFVLWRSLSGPVRTSLPLTALVALIGLAMLWATAYFVASMIRPPLMIEATPRGILTYLDLKSHRYVAESQLIPWQTILHIEYYMTVDAIMPEGARGRFHVDTARLQLKPGHGLPIGDLSILQRLSFPSFDAGDKTGVDWDNTIFLPATTSFGAPQSLAEKLEDLRQASVGAL